MLMVAVCFYQYELSYVAEDLRVGKMLWSRSHIRNSFRPCEFFYACAMLNNQWKHVGKFHKQIWELNCWSMKMYKEELMYSTYLFSPVWILICFVSRDDTLNAFEHTLQTKSFIPVWCDMCALRLSDWLNLASHTLHSYTFTPFSWVFIWYLEFLAIILKQIGHSSVSSSWPNMPLEVLWLFICTFKFIFRLKACSQISHLNLRSDGFRFALSSGLWTIFICLPRVDDAVNALSQISHL